MIAVGNSDKHLTGQPTSEGSSDGLLPGGPLGAGSERRNCHGSARGAT